MKDFIFQYTKNMTQKTEKRYQHLSKPLLSGAIFVASVGLIGAGALAASSSLYNLKAENPTNQNRLTASNWDTLVREVENLKDQLANQAPDVPSGAVMAFESENCPDGWTRYEKADGRFIMGTEAKWFDPFIRKQVSNIGSTWGNWNIQLTIDQLPSHYFYIAWKYVDNNHDYFWNSRSPYLTTKRKADSVDSNYWYDLNGTRNTPEYFKTNTIWNGNAINIQNPYIKLLYCKKN